MPANLKIAYAPQWMDEIEKGPPSPEQVETVADYVLALRARRAWGGSPSLRDLQRRTGLARSTIADALDHRRKRLPALELVVSVLKALDVTPAELECWTQSWRRIQTAAPLPTTTTAAAVAAPDTLAPPGSNPAGAAGRSLPVPNQIPATVADFVGRLDQVERLERALDAPVSAPDVPAGTRVCVVCGPGGVGKSALALHAAHRMRDRFPGGILFADLQGLDPKPADPGAVLAAFLRALGIEGQAMPADVAARAALLHSVTAGRALLFVLDNAHNSEQVRMLLPGPGNAALVTSRSGLAGLAGARLFQLGELMVDEATELLAAVVGRDRVDAEPAAAASVVNACARLPLAVRIAGARLAGRPRWTLAYFADRLVDEHHRLDELHIDDLGIRASFAQSYAALDSGSARAFRLLSVVNAPAVGLDIASALLDLPAREAEQTLESLVDAHLLTTPWPREYGYHDLLRLFARECTQAEDAADDREAAFTRAVHAAAAEIRIHTEHARPRPPGLREPSARVGAHRLAHANQQQWVESQRANIEAYLTQTTNSVEIPSAVSAGMLESVLRAFIIAGLWTELDQCGGAVLAAARRDRDLRAESCARRAIGWAALHHRDLAQATDMFERSLECARQADDLAGEAGTRLALGALEGARKAHRSAIEHQQRAAEIYTRLGRFEIAAVAHNYLGQQLLAAESPGLALDHLNRGLMLARENDDGAVESMSLYLLSAAHSVIGDHGAAVAYGRQALAAARDHQALYSEARALYHFGRALIGAGMGDEGREQLSASAELFDLIGDRHQAAAARAETVGDVTVEPRVHDLSRE